MEGRAALRAYFGSRPADRLSRRPCTNVLVTVETAETARATAYFATYRADGHTGGLVPPGPPVNVGHYEDVLRKTEEGWLIARRTLLPAFGGPTPRLGRDGRG
ncbi:nuclear transport factor 2 family protein [Streptomyces taklimakanensis]|uniref:nuclear transport factor 2 family protein n=1 Tax=Streptomyces taklimakanensis TaxID=2569853 RepID=UPI003B75BE3A